MKYLTPADINPIVEHVVAREDNLDRGTYSFKRIIAETNLNTGATKFYLESQVIRHVNQITTMFKSYTFLDAAITAYNEIQL